VKHHKPRAIILENVPNLLTHDEGRTFKVICATLNNLGYDIHHQMLNAKDFGIPQNRRRIFIVCLRKAVGEDGPLNRFSFPTPPKTPTLVGDILETQVDPKYTISGRRWKGLRERRQRNSQAGKGFGYSLTSGMSVYTNTLTARYPKDGSEILIEQPGRNPRMLTPREAARLQGFADTFVIPVSDRQAYKQIGNSVALPVVKAIAQKIDRYLKQKLPQRVSRRKGIGTSEPAEPEKPDTPASARASEPPSGSPDTAEPSATSTEPANDDDKEPDPGNSPGSPKRDTGRPMGSKNIHKATVSPTVPETATSSESGIRGPHKYSMRARIIHGDSLQILPTIPSDSVDSIVTDPPAGISFLNRTWDHDKGGRDHWIVWMQGIASECLRCAKPGAHALVWAFPRTSHWTTTAFENAGWEVHDVVHHIFGSGFPKSKSVSLCIDKLSGHPNRGHSVAHASRYRPDGTLEPPGKNLPPYGAKTDESKQWTGWGTGLKPAVENWILFRKPLIGTIAKNVLRYGTGALNIDGCRVGTEIISTHHGPKGGFAGGEPGRGSDTSSYASHGGRWPANLVLSNADMLVFPDTKGCSSPSAATPEGRIFGGARSQGSIYDDAGSAARYFNQFRDDGALYVYATKANKADRNGSRHPTIKGQMLMEWLVRLVTPRGGTVLDPFAGSGSTGLAACSQGFRSILVELEAESIEDCRKRLGLWL
jgi:hypothetical protein